MTLRTSFSTVLRALRAKRNISQRDFGDTASRTFLSKLEGGRASPTLDKLEQISQRLDLSPLSLLTLTLSADSGLSVNDLIKALKAEMEGLQRDGGVEGLEYEMRGIIATPASTVSRKLPSPVESRQSELQFLE